jgi:hypothetical protein
MKIATNVMECIQQKVDEVIRMASDNIPCHIIESYPGDCHPIVFLSTLKSFSVW